MTEPIDKKRRPPAFLLSPEFQELSTRSFEKHKSTPGISIDVYLNLKNRELEAILSRRKIIFLDTNHWINLRHVVLGSPREQKGYREILALLSSLHDQQRICCPISFFLFMELMKQSDPDTRKHTARLMDRFSGGVCFQFPLEIARSELMHFFLKRLRPGYRQKAPVWTKTGFLGGQLFPNIDEFPSSANNLMQKAWLDLMWEVGLEQMLDGMDSFDFGTDFWTKYAEASNENALFYRSSKMKYSEVLQREKASLVSQLVREELEEVGRNLWEAFPELRDSSKRPEPPEAEYTPHNFPSLQILAGIIAADMVSTMKFEANDLLDFRHAALAIPYCDVVCCDNPMATRLRNKPCEFEKVYGTRIFGRADEIIGYLKALTI